MKNNIKIYISVLFLFLIGNVNGQMITMSMTAKNFDGEEKSLVDHLDREKNHLILFSAFWCAPCVKAINDIHSKNIEKYRDEYNLKVIILDDEHYTSLPNAYRKIKGNQWYFDMLFLDNQYGENGITSIPRYYFLPAGDSTAFQVSRSTFLDDIDEYYTEIGYESIFFQENQQTIVKEDCQELIISQSSNAPITEINGKDYYDINGVHYRSRTQSKNIYRYDQILHEEIIVFDYYLEKCASFVLRDHEGDEMVISAESREVVDEEIIIFTDAMIDAGCDDEIPFVLSSVYGSNAGLQFDIENGKIVSRLICHQSDGEEIYTDSTLADLCGSVSTADIKNGTEWSLSSNYGNGIATIVGTAKLDNYSIINVSGQLINKVQNTRTIDLSNLAKGIYLIVINDKKSKALKYIKI